MLYFETLHDTAKHCKVWQNTRTHSNAIIYSAQHCLDYWALYNTTEKCKRLENSVECRKTLVCTDRKRIQWQCIQPVAIHHLLFKTVSLLQGSFISIETAVLIVKGCFTYHFWYINCFSGITSSLEQGLNTQTLHSFDVPANVNKSLDAGGV